MVKLASARDFRTYGPGFTRNRHEYINAGLYLFAAVVLTCGFAAQFSYEARSGLVILLLALGLIILVNFHDLIAHLVAIDFRLPLMELDLQLALVEFAVPMLQALGSFFFFLAVFFIFLQEEKGYGYFKLEKHALNMLVVGPVLWVIGSIHNSCQIYERADSHLQILQQSVCIPFLMGSLSFMLGAILNHHEQAVGEIHHGLHLLGRTWIWLDIFGSLLFFVGGLTNLIKVFKMQQIGDGLRLEKLRGGAQEKLMSEREEHVPMILEDQRRLRERLMSDREEHVPMILNDQRKLRIEETEVIMPSLTPYKDVLIGQAS